MNLFELFLTIFYGHSINNLIFKIELISREQESVINNRCAKEPYAPLCRSVEGSSLFVVVRFELAADTSHE